MTDYRTAPAYLQVVPGRYPYEGKVVNATQKRPEVIAPGAVVVRLSIRIPRAAFLPLKPEAEITIPEDLVQHPVEVEAQDGHV